MKKLTVVYENEGNTKRDWLTMDRPKCGYGFEYRYKFEVPANNGYSGVPGPWVEWLNKNVKMKFGWHFDDHIHNPDSPDGLGFYKRSWITFSNKRDLLWFCLWVNPADTREDDE